MVKNISINYLLIFLSILIFYSFAHAYKMIPAKQVDTFKISSPFLITECQNSIWVYSKIEGSIYKLTIPPNVKLQEAFNFQKDQQLSKTLTNLSCFKNNLIVTYTEAPQTKFQNLATLKISAKNTLEFINKTSAPLEGNIPDLTCNNEKCALLIAGNLFFSQTLQKWSRQEIPQKEKIPLLGIDLSKNPFDDWNDKLSVFPREFSRVEFLGNKGFALIEPIATQLIVFQKSKFFRWGQWGAWEGFMMRPKSFQITEEQFYLISDVALKLIFVFDKNGTFLGSLGFNNELIEVNHPIRLYWKKPVLYVLDLIEDKVLSIHLDLKDIQTKPPEKNQDGTPPINLLFEEEKQPGRINLFQRDYALKNRLNQKCLACHDGTIYPSTQNFLPQMPHHPVNKIFKGKTDLPLSENKFVACISCHDAHHGAGSNVEMKTAPFLRKQPNGLCLSCHADHKDLGNLSDNKKNHPQNNKTGCMECHQNHGGVENNLKMPEASLCMSCHKPQKIEHPTLTNFLQTERAEGIQFFKNNITCQSCHSPHLGEHLKQTQFSPEMSLSLKKALLKPYDKTLNFCATCHGNKAVELFSKFHAHMGKKIKK